MRNIQTEKYHGHIPENVKEDDVDQKKKNKEREQIVEGAKVSSQAKEETKYCV